MCTWDRNGTQRQESSESTNVLNFQSFDRQLEMEGLTHRQIHEIPHSVQLKMGLWQRRKLREIYTVVWRVLLVLPSIKSESNAEYTLKIGRRNSKMTLVRLNAILKPNKSQQWLLHNKAGFKNSHLPVTLAQFYTTDQQMSERQ